MSMYVTIIFPPEAVSRYTDQWFVDSHDSWTNNQLLDDVCLAGQLNPDNYKLQLNGVDITMTETVESSCQSNDTLTIVIK